MTRKRVAKPETEFLGRYGARAFVGKSERLPGHQGPRPRLSFVLKVLSGSDPGIIRYLLPYEGQIQEYPDPFEGALATLKSVRIAEAQMVKTMRILADLWINSGKNALDRRVDTPSDRNVVYAPDDNSASLHFWLTRFLFDKEPKYAEMTREGKQRVVHRFPHMNREIAREQGATKALQDYGQKMALYFFAGLLDTPYSRHLTRCDECGRYFGYERAPRRTITTGIYCDRCKGSGSYMRTKATRDARKGEMIGWAADCWPSWNSKQGNRSAWVAEKLNVRIVRQPIGWPTITRRWVTQHQSEIEAEIERRKHATRKN